MLGRLQVTGWAFPDGIVQKKENPEYEKSNESESIKQNLKLKECKLYFSSVSPFQAAK